ncbi:tryptophanyl-tRNA synthetase [Granulicella rosea]|uniref:Tryptophan--tRNA ligase n=1 Tax=Granulicella rosea TaxID=474952 RepID=A0A239LI94_9BACT|nr:tryptophan--tRNA ligase [Granulicella rosea]SNT29642.1 tryptophanyl-tRNA synthetase [Granulicella rosea]
MTTEVQTETTTPRKRVLSGMRPTGRLHLGNYMGALYNWVKLQHEYECYFFIADYHALTTDYADTSKLKDNIREVMLDFLAAGLDPKLCTIFRQSRVPAHFELNDMLAMITPLSWLERVPTYKDQQEQLKEKDLATIGFLGYPLLQSADILVYQPSFVPVGQDQAAHVEITREIARRFNHLFAGDPGGASVVTADTLRRQLDSLENAPPSHGYSNDRIVREIFAGETSIVDPSSRASGVNPVLPEPQVLLTPSPKLPGTDGRKMSKSYGNTILLSDPEPEIRAKLKSMVTDPARVRRTDPGNPDVCPVFDLHKVFSSEETRVNVREGCTTAGIGCIQCKGWLADAVVAELAPIQERRRYFEAHPQEVAAILEAGNAAANKRANQTMQEVRVAVGID